MLGVLFDHMGSYLLPHARHLVYQWFDPGTCGVLVFFLVSGYIVPASLERKGSVRSFWVSRVFRLYPLYLFAMMIAVLFWEAGISGLHGAGQEPGTAGLGSVLMLSNVLDVPNSISVIWTLSYEMTFYLLLTALFMGGLHRRSRGFSLGFALAAVALGGVLPQTALSDSALGPGRLALIADLLIIGGLALAVTRYRVPRTSGAMMAGVTAIVLAAFNGQWVQPWEALTILAVMFTGTMLYRAENGELSRNCAAVLAITVFVMAIAAGLGWHTPATARWHLQWVVTVAVAGATFAGAMALRHKQVPPFLAWLGLISYSVYLLHPLLLAVYCDVFGTHSHHPPGVRVLLTAAFVAVLLGCCALTHRFIEVPTQRLGRKLATWLDSWSGMDRPARAAHFATAEDAAR